MGVRVSALGERKERTSRENKRVASGVVLDEQKSLKRKNTNHRSNSVFVRMRRIFSKSNLVLSVRGTYRVPGTPHLVSQTKRVDPVLCSVAP